MRVLNITLIILLAVLFACKPKRDTLPPVSAPTLEKGESFFNTNNDSAFYYFNLVATTATDSLGIAMAYTYMGIIQSYEGDHFGGQESLLKSITYLHEGREKDQECLSSNFHELGNICLKLKNYDAAIGYYQKALGYIKHPGTRAIALNGIALAYQKKGDFDQAIDIYKSLLVKSTDNKKEYARALSNYAKTKWLKDSGYFAAPELKYALQIRRDSNDNRGLNASYAHLSDYYFASKPDSALYYTQKRYEIAQQIKSPHDEAEALSKLITLSSIQLIKPYFVRYQYLTDSIQTAKNAAKNQFALIRFETEKNKSDNLQLQKDNAQKEIELIQQQLIFAVTVVLFIAAGVYLRLWYKKRRQLLEAASRQAIRENQLKTSQKVHDVVANGLYHLMTDIQYKPSIDKEQLIDKIEGLYEQSRDISYDEPVISNLPLYDKINDLLKSFASDSTRVGIVGNDPVIWRSIDKKVQHEVEHILLEMMINMKKHSEAQSVLIKFEQKNDHIHIYYSDDGIGLSPQFKHGNGLRNTGNRIEKIGGQHTFEHPAKGLKVHISFPIAQTL